MLFFCVSCCMLILQYWLHLSCNFFLFVEFMIDFTAILMVCLKCFISFSFAHYLWWSSYRKWAILRQSYNSYPHYNLYSKHLVTSYVGMLLFSGYSIWRLIFLLAFHLHLSWFSHRPWANLRQNYNSFPTLPSVECL